MRLGRGLFCYKSDVNVRAGRLNNFFVSSEREFNLSLDDRPVVVLSNNDGCVIVRSNEAKKLGVKMGDPYFKFKDFFRQHNVAVCSSNTVLYLNMSGRVMNLLRRFAPATEVYSVDEAFIDFSGLFGCHAVFYFKAGDTVCDLFLLLHPLVDSVEIGEVVGVLVVVTGSESPALHIFKSPVYGFPQQFALLVELA